MPSRCSTLKGKVSSRLICKSLHLLLWLFSSRRLRGQMDWGRDMGMVAQSPLLPRTQVGSGQEPGPSSCPVQPSFDLPSTSWASGSLFVGKCARNVGSPGEDFPVVKEEVVGAEVGGP